MDYFYLYNSRKGKDTNRLQRCFFQVKNHLKILLRKIVDKRVLIRVLLFFKYNNLLWKYNLIKMKILLNKDLI